MKKSIIFYLSVSLLFTFQNKILAQSKNETFKFIVHKYNENIIPSPKDSKFTTSINVISYNTENLTMSIEERNKYYEPSSCDYCLKLRLIKYTINLNDLEKVNLDLAWDGMVKSEFNTSRVSYITNKIKTTETSYYNDGRVREEIRYEGYFNLQYKYKSDAKQMFKALNHIKSLVGGYNRDLFNN